MLLRMASINTVFMFRQISPVSKNDADMKTAFISETDKPCYSNDVDNHCDYVQADKPCY